MAYNEGFNHDDRGQEQKYVARGHRSETITVTIASAAQNGSTNFSANGKLIGLLIPSFTLTGVSATITDIDINPEDMADGEALVVEIGTLTLAEGTDHFIRVAEHTTNNLEAFMFGQMTIKITISAPTVGGTGDDITVIPILGKH